ncbi:outer envelope protein 64, mitochondrial-like [Phragmites australis]|uniref:outer envelope protein 64, mitochondrial-like n=1 Tax=Phragmites australis TaxID=29695 RepID=UPI002D793150|nr:outer envelope protein 64, mitochondrial-like [Phragmites australis]
MDSSAGLGGAGGGWMIASNPRVWIVAGIAIAGVIVLVEAARPRRRWLHGKAGVPPDAGAFCDRFELSPPPQPPPPAARHLLAGLTFAVSDSFEIEGYVAGFGNPDWKRTHEAARHTAVAVTMLRKQGGTCVGRTIMDELGFGVTGENLHCGTPVNSASPSLVPGGSCSGSAVAVCAQLVDFALGTDTIGDVRIPASFCGLLCFRPSYGVVSTLGTIANSQSLDTIGWFARDPCVLHRVGDVLLPAAAGGLKQSKQIVFADDCFQFLKVYNQKIVHAIKYAVQTLPGYQPPKHINIGQYIRSNVPSLKEFCEPATRLQEGMMALKTLSAVMLLLQRYEFKANHKDWVNTVKPKLGLDISTRVLRAVNFTHDNIKSLYAIRNELRAALKNLLKDSGILVLPTTAGYPLKRNSKERLSSGFEDRIYAFVGIAAFSGCCEATIPLANHSDHHISLSFVAAHGSDKFLLRTILDTYSLIQEQVALASKLVTTQVTNGDVDVDASELLKEKGNSAFKRRQWSKAVEFYSQAISLSDSNATYYCNRAAAYLELGRFKQAEADCDRALLLDTKNVKAYLRRGTAKEVTMNHQEALQDFRHALALEPQNKAALAAERRLQKLLK